MSKSEKTSHPFKCIVLGDTSVGKSSIVYRLIRNNFSTGFKATIGADFQMKQIQFTHTIDNEIKTFTEDIQVWDPPRYCRFPGISLAHYKYCHAAIVVYDTTNRKSFESVKDWIDELLVQTNAKNTNQKLSIAIVGNKTDIKWKREVTFQELQGLCNKYRRNDKYFTMERMLDETKSHLLLNGFIRKTQMEISRLIPMDICRLCFDFYFEFDASTSIIHGYEVSAKDGADVDEMLENVIKVCKTAEYYYPNQNPWPTLKFLDLSDDDESDKFPIKSGIFVTCIIIILAVLWKRF